MLALGPPESRGWEHPGAGVGKPAVLPISLPAWQAAPGHNRSVDDLGTSFPPTLGCVQKRSGTGSGCLLWDWGLEGSQLLCPFSGSRNGGKHTCGAVMPVAWWKCVMLC